MPNTVSTSPALLHPSDGVESAIRRSSPKASPLQRRCHETKQLDEYRLSAPLGRGGMAEVFLAAKECANHQRSVVVIKRLYSHFGEDPIAVQMFLDEARLVIGLDHPNIVKTYEVGLMGGQYCIAMEYLAGQPLQRIIRRNGSAGGLPVDLAVLIAIRMLEALEYAHEACDSSGKPLGIVHRDISPHNVFVTNTGLVKVLDFGIAKAACHEGRTATGLIKGKFAYIAPEQAQAQGVDGRADIWSVGVVLWEMLMGQRLFKADNDAATLRATLRAEVPRVSQLRDAVSVELDRIVLRALQRHTNLRYRSASEMKRDLLGYLQRRPQCPDERSLEALMFAQFPREAIEQQRAVKELLQATESRPSEPTRIPANTQSTIVTQGSALAVEASRIEDLVQELTRQRRAGHRTTTLAAIAIVATLILGAIVVLSSIGHGNAGPTQANRAPALLERAVVATNQPQQSGTPTIANEPSAQAQRERVHVERTVPSASRASVHATGPIHKTQSASASVASAATSTTPPAAIAEFGYLTIDSTPWSVVTVNGRSLGQTPVVKARLPVGVQVLQMRSPDLGIETSYSVTIEAGKTIVKRIGLE